MAVISLLKKLNSQEIDFYNHPCSSLSDNAKINYLKGISIVANEDTVISKSEIEYLNILVDRFNLTNEQVKGLLKEIKKPNKDMLYNIITTIKAYKLEQHFILDCLLISHVDGEYDKREKKLIQNYETTLNISEKESKELNKFFKYLKSNNDEKIASLFQSSSKLKESHFAYLMAYYNINLLKYQEEPIKVDDFGFEFEELKIRRGCLKNATHILKHPISNKNFTIFLNDMLQKNLIKVDKKGNTLAANSKRILLSYKNKDIILHNKQFISKKSAENNMVVYVTFSAALMFISWINKKLNTNYRLTEFRSDRYNNLSLDDISNFIVGHELFIKDGRYSKKNTSNLIGLSNCSSVPFEFSSNNSSFRMMY